MSQHPRYGPLDRLKPHFYEEVWDLLDALDNRLSPGDQTSTLVVSLGDGPHQLAHRLVDVIPHARYYDSTAEAELEAVLAQRLRESSKALPRLHVCVVAGAITNEIAALWALKRIATTIERFLDEEFAEEGAQLCEFGDETFYVSLVTNRAFIHPTDTSAPNSSHAALVGARRVLVCEQSRLRWRLVDIDPDTGIADLTAELSVPGAFCQENADEVLLRHDHRWTPVITRTLPRRSEEMTKQQAGTWRDVVIDPEGSYLITGGYHGLAVATGRWLVRRGARRLVLASRSGATTDFARSQIALWRRAGIDVIEETVNVTDVAAVAALVNRSHGTTRPLRGIFHTTRLVAEQNVVDLELDTLRRVYESSVDVARALWSAINSAGIQLDQFVFYSSGGSMLGISGQYAYTAANLAVQSLAEAIGRQGQPAACIGWGHVLASIGMDDDAICLEETLRSGVTQAAITPVDWSKLNNEFGHFKHVLRSAALVEAAAQEDSAGVRMRAALLALDKVTRVEVVAYMLAELLAAFTGMSADAMEIDIPATELGLDSWMAIHFRNRISQALGVPLDTLPLGNMFDLRRAGAHIAETVMSAQGVARTSDSDTQPKSAPLQ